MKVTVLVAIYKAGVHLAGKLKDLEAQSWFKRSNIILLNCQNLDDEKSVYSEFAKSDNVTVKEYGHHIKLYDSWNDGIRMSDSEYIVNSNVDDRWHPQYLERLARHLDEHKDVGVVSSLVDVTDVANSSWPWKPISNLAIGYPGGTAGPCPMWRRELHKHGYFESYSIISDALMWETWLRNGVKFGIINEPLALYYTSSKSLERRLDEHGRKLIDMEISHAHSKKV